MTARSTTFTCLLASGAVITLAVLGGTSPALATTPTPAPTTAAPASPTPTPARPTTPTPTPVAPKPIVSKPIAPKPVASKPVAPRPTATTTPTATATPTPSATPTVPAPVLPTAPAVPPVLQPTPTPTPIVPLPVVATIDKHSGHTSNARSATITGTHFENLAGVQIAGVAVDQLVVQSPTTARFVLPAAIDYQPKLAAVTVTALSDRTPRATGLTFQYLVTSRLDRQMAYAFANWNSFSNARFGYLSGNDCANFASQTLLARGWKPSDEWFNSGPGRWSGTWVSSTALSSWLKKRPDLVTKLTYSQRDAVTVGDVVQFRWPGHAKSYTAWDHTGIVSKVVVLPNGRHDVYYTSHTYNRQYGGSTGSLATWYAGRKAKGQTLRIQFFHLLK